MLVDSPVRYRMGRKAPTLPHHPPISSSFSNVVFTSPTVSPMTLLILFKVVSGVLFPHLWIPSSLPEPTQLYFRRIWGTVCLKRQMKSQCRQPHNVSFLPMLFRGHHCQVLGFSESPLESPLFVSSVFLFLGFILHKGQRPIRVGQ